MNGLKYHYCYTRYYHYDYYYVTTYPSQSKSFLKMYAILVSA